MVLGWRTLTRSRYKRGRATTIEVETDLDGPIFARWLEWTLTTIHFELVREGKTFVAYPLRFTPERSAAPPR